MREALLIPSTKLILRICAKFTIIWRIEEDEVIVYWHMLLEEIFKIHILYDGTGKMALHFWRLHISDLSCQVFSIVRNTTIGNIELTTPLVPKTLFIGILSHNAK